MAPPVFLVAPSSDVQRYLQDVYRQAFNDDEALKDLEKELNTQVHCDFVTPGESNKVNALPHYAEDTVEGVLYKNGFHECDLDLPSAYLNTDTNVHPLFRYENFDKSLGETVARQAWEALQPALALATKFLTHPSALSWFYHLMYASVEIDPQTGKRYLAYDIREANLEAAHADFMNLLADLSNHMTFYWRPERYGRTGVLVGGTFNKSIWGVLREFDDATVWGIQRRHCAVGPNDPFHGHIGLSTTYLYQSISPIATSRQSVYQKMRLNFEIACTLCHELAHAIYCYRKLPWPEPYVFLSDGMPEVGLSWDMWVFGAKVDLNIDRTTKIIGLMFSRTWTHAYTYPGINAPVPMDWVQKWFRKDTWDNLDVALSNTAYLWMPETLTRPRFFIADRFYDGIMWDVLYMDDKLVCPSWLKGKVSNPPYFGALERWYHEVSQREIKLAIESGRYKTEDFSGAWGTYSNMLKEI